MIEKNREFFVTKIEEKKQKPKKKKIGCKHCKLEKNKVPVYGKGNKKILLISSEAPEDVEPYSNTYGTYIKKHLNKLNINPKSDCWFINAIQCPTNKKITTGMLSICRPNLLRFIKKNNPEKIIVFGEIALQALLGHRMSVTGIHKWTGYKIPDQKHKAWIYPMLSPKYILDNPYIKMAEFFFKKDLRSAIKHNEEFPNNIVKENQLNLITEMFPAKIYLEGLLKSKHITELTFDYETTGIKPHALGHEILCISFSFDNTATSFPIFKDKEFLRLLRKVLISKNIKKISHNLLFEDAWTKVKLGYNVQNWHWDSMICAHILNNASGTTGLKFQTYVRYGISEYNKEVEKFITSEEKSANSFNKLREVPLLELLKYCALDSLFTFKLYKDQKKELNEKTGLNSFNLFMKGIQFLSEMSLNGCKVDPLYFIKQNELLIKKKRILDKKILRSDEVQKWDGEEEFNHNSDKQLRHLLFGILRNKGIKETKGGQKSVDAEALESFRNKYTFVDNILKWRKYDKIQNTYLASILREEVDGLIHSNFSLHIPVSGRGSVNNINLQNVPKRDEYAQKIIRTGFIPRPGRRLLEVDYSSIEVRVGACVHKDPKMIEYVTDPSTDMHGDMGKIIFKNDEITKEERYQAKNKFVFPEFYGSYYKSCTRDLWKSMSESSMKHLFSMNIKNYTQFEMHIKKVENDFWNRRFRKFNEWRKNNWNEYMRKGYLNSVTGFYYSTLMQEKDTMNYPIQGPAFHCLLWSGFTLNDYLKENKYETLIINQIHDALLFDVIPDELEELKPIIRKVMTEDIKEFFPWIIVPLDIEAEISTIDGNWAEMEGIEI